MATNHQYQFTAFALAYPKRKSPTPASTLVKSRTLIPANGSFSTNFLSTGRWSDCSPLLPGTSRILEFLAGDPTTGRRDIRETTFLDPGRSRAQEDMSMILLSEHIFWTLMSIIENRHDVGGSVPHMLECGVASELWEC